MKRLVGTDRKVLMLFFSLFIVIVIIGIPGIFAELQLVKSIEIYSEKLNYKNNEPGSWKITKSVKWINQKEAEITIELDSTLKIEEKYTDMIFVLDTSGSMEGERLDMVKSTTTSLADKLLSDENNRVALITFDQGSSIVLEFTNEKDTFIDKVNSLTAQWVTNYYQALVNVDKLMKNYVKEDSRECVVVFLTDGYPNYDTPNEVGQYNYLKKTYSYLLINAIQYEMGNDVTNEVKRISDNQYVANVGNLEDILNEATVVPMVYENFNIEDVIDKNYFYIESKNDVKADFGSVTFDEDKQSINWSLDGLRTGKSSTLTVKVKVKDELREDIFPVNESINIRSSLGDVREDINSKLTPVLKEKYEVIYDVNAPSECRGLKSPDVEKHSVFETVGVSEEEPKCEGYQFKGWKYVTNSAKRINDDYFIMPEEDVNIKGTWSKLDISKSMDGTVKEQLTLYKQVQEDFNNPSKYVRKYTGDTSTFNGNEDVYYYYGSASNNNVIFANYCWKIVRTTDTGGVKLLYNGVPSNDLKCNNTKDDSQLTAEQMNTGSNKVAFNNQDTSPADVGYMYNKSSRYTYTSYPNLSKNLSILYVKNVLPNDEYFYADDYNYLDLKYKLISPKTYTWEENYEKLVGKYTFMSTTSDSSQNKLYYIVRTEKDNIYCVELADGYGINDIGYETTITLSDGFDDNGDGTYTLNNPIEIEKQSWFSNYNKYLKYFTCGSNELVCNGETLRQVVSANSTSMTYLNYVLIKYGNSFEYDGSKYILKDTVDVFNPSSDSNLKNHHYTCFNSDGICDSLSYVYSTQMNISYISLKDGKSVEDALNEMLYDENVNNDSSNIRMAIDYWYSNHMADYTKYLEDTVWCNDRTMDNTEHGWNPNGGNLGADILFSSWGGGRNSEKLTCLNNNDSFTVNKDNGNGVLTYPVGLITWPEFKFSFFDAKSPLLSGGEYRLITPYRIHYYLTGGTFVHATGLGTTTVARGMGVRPSISLQAGIEYSNGDGSVDSPYIIVTD